MIRKIKSSLWLKVFLLLTVLLFVVSLLLYGTIMAVMPASYRYTLTTNYTEQLSQLITDLERRSVDDATQRIYEFCINHNAGALLSGNETSLTFGKEILDEQEQDAFQTASTALALADGTYTLQIMMSARTVNQLNEAFWRLIPIIGIVVLAISLIVSCFVTRLLTKPILEISDISKRLTTLDMTWRCNTSRTDEVGTLALNLNTMAARLDSTLKELSAANEKLQADIEQERRLEKLRVDFFQAVSHELKTPITVLKGELEGMIYQVGEYKDRDAHLREIFQSEDRLTAIIYRPPLLGVRLYHALAPEQGLIAFLEEMERLLHQPFSVWPKRSLGDKFHAVAAAQLLHSSTTKLPAFVCDNFIGETMGRPLLRVDGDAMPPAPLHLVPAGVL